MDHNLVSAVDIAPTLLGLAGIRPPSGAMQGQDLFGLEYKPTVPTVDSLAWLPRERRAGGSREGSAP